MTEGSYPKVDGDVYYGTEVNYTLQRSALAKMGVLRTAQWGQSWLVPVTGNFFDNFSSDTATTKTGLTLRANGYLGEYTKATAGAYSYISQGILIDSNATWGYTLFDYEIFTVIDECDNSSLSATNFPTSTNCTEGTNGIAVAKNGALITKDLSGIKVINFLFSLSCTAVAGAASVLLFRDSGANTATVLTANGGGGGGAALDEQKYAECTVYLDWANKKCWYNISAYEQSNPSGTQAGGYIRSYTKTVYLSLAGWATFSISITTTDVSTASATFSYMRAGLTSPTTTSTISLSADNGSNFTTTGNGTPCKLGTAGTTLQAKIAGTVATGEVISIKGMQLGKIA